MGGGWPCAMSLQSVPRYSPKQVVTAQTLPRHTVGDQRSTVGEDDGPGPVVGTRNGPRCGAGQRSHGLSLRRAASRRAQAVVLGRRRTDGGKRACYERRVTRADGLHRDSGRTGADGAPDRARWVTDSSGAHQCGTACVGPEWPWSCHRRRDQQELGCDRMGRRYEVRLGVLRHPGTGSPLIR
jgi:hypothetical protein